jgi:hypothetical protein
MVLTTGVTTSTRVASVLADTTVTGGLVSSLLPVVVSVGRHDLFNCSCVGECKGRWINTQRRG